MPTPSARRRLFVVTVGQRASVVGFGTTRPLFQSAIWLPCRYTAARPVLSGAVTLVFPECQARPARRAVSISVSSLRIVGFLSIDARRRNAGGCGCFRIAYTP